MIKTNKRHVIPLTEPALHILQRWQEKRAGCRYVFNLVKDDLDLDDAEALYKARNNATKCINVGEQMGLPFTLSMHCSRHINLSYLLKNKKLTKAISLTGNDMETSGLLYSAMFCTNQKNAFLFCKRECFYPLFPKLFL